MKTLTVFRSKIDGLVERSFFWFYDNLLSYELWMIIPLPKRLSRAILKQRLLDADLDDIYEKLCEDEKKV